MEIDTCIYFSSNSLLSPTGSHPINSAKSSVGLPCKEPCAKSPDKAQGLVLPTPLQKLRFLWASPARSLVPRTLTRHKGWFCQHRYQNDYMLCSRTKLYISKTQQINIPGLSWQRRSPVLPDPYAAYANRAKQSLTKSSYAFWASSRDR